MNCCHHPRHSAEAWSHARLTLHLWILRGSDPDIWSPSSFNESQGQAYGRKSMCRRCRDDSPHSREGSNADGFIQRSPVCYGGSSACHKVSFFTQCDTIHALKVTGIFGLCVSTRPKDYVQTHPCCLFPERRHSSCQPSLGRGLFVKSDGRWEFRMSCYFPYLNLNAH